MILEQKIRNIVINNKNEFYAFKKTRKITQRTD